MRTERPFHATALGLLLTSLSATADTMKPYTVQGNLFDEKPRLFFSLEKIVLTGSHSFVFSILFL